MGDKTKLPKAKQQPKDATLSPHKLELPSNNSRGCFHKTKLLPRTLLILSSS